MMSTHFLFFVVFLLLLVSVLLMKVGKGCGKTSPAIIVGVILFVLSVALIAFFDEGRHIAIIPQTAHEATDRVEQATGNLSDTLGNLEKEFDEFTKPQIDLSDETEAVPVTKLKTKPKLSEPLPDWVTEPPKSRKSVWWRVVATEPCFTIESLSQTQQKLFEKTLSEYLAELLDTEIPESFYTRLVRQSDFPHGIFKQHTENRETSVGEAFISHLFFSIKPSDNEWFLQQWEAWKTKEHRANHGMRVAGVGLLSGAVLCGLALLYGLLRMTEK